MTNQHASFLFLFLFFAGCTGQNQFQTSANRLNPSIKSCDFTLSGKPEGKTKRDSFAPPAYIRDILQDKTGKLWFGSWEHGLFSYDYTDFKEYEEPYKVGRHIHTLCELKSGKIWMGTWQNGIYVYDPSATPASIQLASTAFCKSSAGCASGKSFQYFTQKDGLNDDYIHTIFEDKKGNIWIGTAAGLCLYDGKQFINISKKENLSTQGIYKIAEDLKGRLWFGGEEGVFYYDEQTFHPFSKADGTNYQEVRSIIADKKGNIWLGCLEGLFVYNGKNIEHFSQKEPQLQHAVWNIYEDSKGNIWFGLYDYHGFGAGLCCYDGKNCTYFGKNEGLPDNRVFCITEDKEGTLWIGTVNGLCSYNKQGFTYFEKIFDPSKGC